MTSGTKGIDSFGSISEFQSGSKTHRYFSFEPLRRQGFAIDRLPYSLRILLENLLRHEDGVTVKAEDVLALAGWNAKEPVDTEIAFMPARVLLQDFTGVPALVDLAAMREAMAKMGGDPKK